MKKLQFAALLAVLVVTGACTSKNDNEVAGRGNIRAIHAVSDMGGVSFKIEERQLASTAFQSTSGFSPFDSLEYDFNFDFTNVVTDTVQRVGRVTFAVVPDTNYTLALVGTAGNTSVLQAARPERVWDGTESVLEVWFSHLANYPNPIDVYIGAPGFDPQAATAVVTGLARHAFSAISELTAGEYEFVITPAGDAMTELMRTEAVTLAPADTVLAALHDNVKQLTGDYALVLAGNFTGLRLVDDRAVGRLRFAHAAQTIDTVDVYVNDDFTAPRFAAVPFKGITGALDIAEVDDLAAVTFTGTPVGDMGTTIVATELVFADAANNVLVLTGTLAEPRIAPITNSQRPLFNVARVGVFNASSTFDTIDIFVLEAGAVVADSQPRYFNVTPSIGLGQFNLAPGDYELYAANSADDAIVVGPVAMTLSARDVVEVMIVDTAGGQALEIVSFPIN